MDALNTWRRDSRALGWFSLIVFASLAMAACPSPVAIHAPRSDDANVAHDSCAGLATAECSRAQTLLRAAASFSNVRHEYLFDASSTISPGRGVERASEGAYSLLPMRCAEERGGPAANDGRLPPRVDPSTIDFTYVGVKIGEQLVGADADLTPWLSAGAEAAETNVALIALAFVRDSDPQFFGASSEVAFRDDACTCGRATHFVGAVKMGGLLSYEMTIRRGELRGRALEFVKARLQANDARVAQTSVGGLEIEGLETAAAEASAAAALSRPLRFRVRNPVPIAYALYPLSDVCRFSFPAPEVAPEITDFGVVPYGQEETKFLHVVNRAPLELRATLGERTFAIPALGSADVPWSWRPEGSALGCEPQTREEVLAFAPRDRDVPVTPRTQSVRVVARARSGKPAFGRHEHVDTGVHRKPDYAATKREWSCPADYAVAACRTERAECGDGRCASDGYAVNAEPTENGCRFGCSGPEGYFPGISSMFCRFDAVMECRLRCR